MCSLILHKLFLHTHCLKQRGVNLDMVRIKIFPFMHIFAQHKTNLLKPRTYWDMYLLFILPGLISSPSSRWLRVNCVGLYLVCCQNHPFWTFSTTASGRSFLQSFRLEVAIREPLGSICLTTFFVALSNILCTNTRTGSIKPHCKMCTLGHLYSLAFLKQCS